MANDDDSNIVPWWGAWMEQRLRTLRQQEAAAARVITEDSDLTWSALIERFGNDAAGLLFCLLNISGGSRSFECRLSDFRSLVAMSVERFDFVLTALIEDGVINMVQQNDTAWWMVL